jgi:type VI secretion system protein ImpA
LNVSELLKPISEDVPSGENQEYAECFLALERASQPGEERQVGDDIIPAEEPNYVTVSELAEEVMKLSHDLRAAVQMAHAELRLGNMDDFAEVTKYVRGCIEDNWDTCHPQLDADDDNDPTMRVNSLLELSSSNTIIRALRLVPLTNSAAFGRVCLRDIMVAQGEMERPSDMEKSLDLATVNAAFSDTAEENLKEKAEAAKVALENLKAIEDKFNTEIPGLGPSFAEVNKVLEKIILRLEGANDLQDAGASLEDQGENTEITNDEVEGEGVSSAQSPTLVASVAVGAIRSIADVKKTLDQVITYYEKNEPSSPVPVLIKRAKRLVGADFVSIIKDIAPNGMDNVEIVAGITDDDD